MPRFQGVAQSKNDLAGSARQRATFCGFVVFVQGLGALPVQKINRNKGRTYEKNFDGEMARLVTQGGSMAEIASQLTGQWCGQTIG
jgi:hypothetical protein